MSKQDALRIAAQIDRMQEIEREEKLEGYLIEETRGLFRSIDETPAYIRALPKHRLEAIKRFAWRLGYYARNF